MNRPLKPIANSEQYYLQLAQSLDELTTIYLALEDGDLTNIQDTLPREVFGDDIHNIAHDEDLRDGRTSDVLFRASSNCIDSFEEMTEAEVRACALFEAARDFSAETGKDVLGHKEDLEASELRLRVIATIVEEYQGEAWEERVSPVSQARAIARPTYKREERIYLDNDVPYHTRRLPALEKVTDKSLICGHNYLFAAQAIMAEEVLRLTYMDPKPADLSLDADFQSALKAAKQNLEWAGTVIQNGANASPVITREWADENVHQPLAALKAKLN